MSHTQPLATTDLIRAQSKTEVSVGGDTLFISDVHVWRNDQPRIGSLAEEVERSSSSRIINPTNITLTIRRNNTAGHASEDGLDSSTLPYIVALHILRSDYAESLTASDDPTTVHFAWPAPPALTTAATETAYEGGYFVAQAADGGQALKLSAWNGPTWSTLRNGIDDTIDYIAIVQFQDGIFLASDKHRVEVVH